MLGSRNNPKAKDQELIPGPRMDSYSRGKGLLIPGQRIESYSQAAHVARVGYSLAAPAFPHLEKLPIVLAYLAFRYRIQFVRKVLLVRWVLLVR